MACLLQPECNFLHGYFRYQLPVEVVDVEVKITSIQAMYIFWRDRMTQLIKCTPWSMRVCPHPTIVKKMWTYLEVEGKMGPITQPTNNQYSPPQLDTDPNVRKNKATEKRKRAVSTKRFRPREAATCPPMTTSKAPTNDRPQMPEEASDSRPPPLENVPVCENTPWPDAGKISGNLFEERKDWLLPPNYLNNDNKDTTDVISPKPHVKEEPKTDEQSFDGPKSDKFGWGPNCPFCKNQEKEEEDWDGNHQKQLKQKTLPQPEIQIPQARCPQTLNYQRPQNSQKPSQDQYLSQSKICKQWEAEIERLNAKYNLDCFSDSELNLESDEGEQYKYEHGYETLI